MPAVRRISRDAIVDAAVEVLREGGFSAVNARSVAKKLGCATRPIYSSVQNMDGLKAALRARAIALHTQRVQDSLRAHEGNDTRYSSYGMGFVKFAAEEKQLFRCCIWRAGRWSRTRTTFCCRRSCARWRMNSATRKTSRAGSIRT